MSDPVLDRIRAQALAAIRDNPHVLNEPRTQDYYQKLLEWERVTLASA